VGVGGRGFFRSPMDIWWGLGANHGEAPGGCFAAPIFFPPQDWRSLLRGPHVWRNSRVEGSFAGMVILPWGSGLRCQISRVLKGGRGISIRIL